MASVVGGRRSEAPPGRERARRERREGEQRAEPEQRRLKNKSGGADETAYS
jgi:hypothetical protein